MTGARRPRASARSRAPVSSAPSGSIPSRAAKNASQRRRGRAPARRCRSGAGRRSAARGRRRGAKIDALVRRVGRGSSSSVAGHAQVHEQEDLVGELQDEVLAPAAQPLDAPALHGVDELVGRAAAAHQRGSRISRRCSDAPLDVGGELAADRLDLGKLGHRLPRVGRRGRQNGTPGSLDLAAGQPAQRVAPTSAIGPSWRWPSEAWVDGQQRHVLARVVAVVGVGVDAVVGGQDQQVVGAAAAPASRRRRRRSRAARRGSPRRPCGGRRAGRSRRGW